MRRVVIVMPVRVQKKKMNSNAGQMRWVIVVQLNLLVWLIVIALVAIKHFGITLVAFAKLVHMDIFHVTCPSGGTSDVTNNSVITDCYTTSNIYNAAAHGTIKQTCRYSSSTSSYSICSTTSLVDCDAGYYRVNTSDLSCTAVGTSHYSPASSFTRTSCPTYTNPSGGTSYGQTTGSGTGADAITDCKIPETEKFTDSTGSWVYSGGCAYSN